MIVIDLENTLSNSAHRMHLLYNCKHDEFQNAFKCDSLNVNVKMFMDQFANQGTRVVILTAKSDKYKEIVINWLEKYDVNYNKLIMKPSDKIDISDVDFKREFISKNKEIIWFALDDVGAMCRLYSEYNIPCLRIEQK